jgi:hypothetical protein
MYIKIDAYRVRRLLIKLLNRETFYSNNAFKTVTIIKSQVSMRKYITKIFFNFKIL